MFFPNDTTEYSLSLDAEDTKDKYFQRLYKHMLFAYEAYKYSSIGKGGKRIILPDDEIVYYDTFLDALYKNVQSSIQIDGENDDDASANGAVADIDDH